MPSITLTQRIGYSWRNLIMNRPSLATRVDRCRETAGTCAIFETGAAAARRHGRETARANGAERQLFSYDRLAAPYRICQDAAHGAEKAGFRLPARLPLRLRARNRGRRQQLKGNRKPPLGRHARGTAVARHPLHRRPYSRTNAYEHGRPSIRVPVPAAPWKWASML